MRALTRVATPMNEGDLVMLAQHATASQVERIVSAYRGVLSVEQEVEAANRQVAEQYLRTDWEDDGTMVIHARVPAEVGAVVLKALESARGAPVCRRAWSRWSRGTCPQASERHERRCAARDGGIVPGERSRGPHGW